MFLRKWTLKFQNKFFSFRSLSVLVNFDMKLPDYLPKSAKFYIIWSVNGNLVHVLTKMDA